MKTPELDLFERLQGAQAVIPTAPTDGSPVEKMVMRDEPVNVRNLFYHHDVHPLVLDMALLKAFGVEWMTWEAETIWSEIRHVFKPRAEISDSARAKIQAVRALHTSDSPWDHWQVFEKIIQALNNNLPRADVVQPPTIEQLYVGIDIINEIRTATFHAEVKAFIAAAVLHDDLFYVPPPLDFVQTEVAHPMYECLDCGNIDSALFHDGLCDTCTNKFDPEHNLSMRPDAESIAKGSGKNLKLTLKFNPDPIEKRWKELEHTPSAEVELHETLEDIQVSKLLMARDYMNIRRRQLAEQLTSLKAWLGAS